MSQIGSHFRCTLRRKGKVIFSKTVYNSLTREGMEYFAGILFLGTGVGSVVWKFGLIDEENFVEIDVEDTLGSHSGWTEITDYPRVVWPKDTIQSSPAYYVGTISEEFGTWEFDTSGSFRGFFMTNDSLLLSTAVLDDARPFLSGDKLEATYTIFCLPF